MKNRYEIIIFDFDDTLFDYERTEKKALCESFKIHDLLYKEEYYEIFKTINRTMWEIQGNDHLTTSHFKIKRFERFFEKISVKISPEIFSNTYTECSENGDLIDGVEEVINKLFKDIILIAASNGPCTPRIEKLSNSAIAGKLIFYSSESFVEGYSKPNPQFFYSILEDFKVSSPDKVLVVGDKLATDILCANRAGFRSVLFKFREHNEDKSIANPDFTINDFRELLEIVYK